MSEFVGRTGSNRLYSYPDTRRSGNPLTVFARNFATGPKNQQDISGGGVQILWNAIDVGTSSADVPITPRSTGIVLVSGVVSIQNQSGFAIPGGASVSVQVNNGAALIPSGAAAPLADQEIVTIPFLVEVTGLTVGTTYNIEIFVSGDTATLLAEASSVDVQEVSVATG
jgi:hypothetical protein